MYRVRTFSVVVSLLVQVFCIPLVVRSEPGLDVVLVIDQSGSMSGHPEHPGKNDPNGHRISVARSILERLALQVTNSPLSHRLSVVEFGTHVEVRLSNEKLIDDPTDRLGPLRQMREKGERELQVRQMDYTDTDAALKRALEEFRKMAPSGVLPERRRVLLLITDGRPYVSGQPLEVRQNNIRKVAQDLKRAGVQMWVIGLNDADNYWNAGDGTFWEEIAGGPSQARLAGDAYPSIPSISRAIMDEWQRIQSRKLERSEYDCPPYLRRIVFDVHFSAPTTPVPLYDPDKRAIMPEAGSSDRVPSAYAIYVVDNPKPGTYRLQQSPGRGSIVYVEEYSPRAYRLGPPEKVAPGVESPVVFQVRRATSTDLLVPDPAWPIKAQVDIVSPSGTAPPLNVTVAPAGTFETTWRPGEPGNHRFKLRGTVTRKDGSIYDVFAQNAEVREEVVEVTRHAPLWLQLDTPALPGKISILPWKSLTPLALTFLQADGTSVPDANTFVTNPETWLSLQPLDPSGVNRGAALPLQYSQGRFTTDLPIALNWKRGEGWWYAGQVNVKVVAQPGALRDERHLNGVRLPKAAQESRVQGDPMSVGGVAIGYPLWLFLLAGVLVVGVPVALVGLGLAFLIPKMLIRREDARRKGTVQLVIFNAEEDPTGLNGKAYAVTGQVHFTFDRQLSINDGDKTVTANTLRVKRRLSPGRPEAELRYQWNGTGKHYRLMLRAGNTPRRLEGLSQANYMTMLKSNSSTR